MKLYNAIKKDDTSAEELALTGCAIMVIEVILFIIYPIICYWSGWCFGVFAQHFVGEEIIQGFSYLNITIPHDHIPEICGAINVFGWCLRGTNTFVSNNDLKK